MRRRWTAAVLAAVLSTGCADDSGDALSETARNLSELRSGMLDARLVIRAEGARGGDVGFRLVGPFALARRKGELPTARIAYTQLAGPRRAKLDFLSARDAAFVRVEGTWYRLPPARTRGLRGLGPSGTTSDRLPIDDWIRDPTLERRGEVDRITGELAVGEAVSALLAMAERLGGAPGLGRLGDAGRRQLDDAARDARVEVLTGHDDRLLRRLRLHAALRTEPARAGSLGRLRGACIGFGLAVDRPNRPVRVRPPRAALDYAELTG